MVIIGVIAAMTVPTLINKTNNQEYVSKLKKAYSTLAQATNLIIAEEGSPKNGWVGDLDHTYNLYKKHLVYAKDCAEVAGCFEQLSSSQYKQLNGDLDQGSWNSNTGSSYRRMVLADGVQLMFIYNYFSDQCDKENWASSNVCGQLIVDINGRKKPNTIGRDVFSFMIKENGLYPAGCDQAENTCNGTENNGRGFGCACKVLREGAMNY